MAIYINKERTHEHEQEIRSFARQAGRPAAEIEAGVQTLKDLVDYWVDRAEQGEK